MLNLVAIANNHKSNPEYHARPFFTTPILNECIVLKHRIRADERFVFDDERQNSTKIILPFERADLRMGGRSFFVGQRGWRDIVRETGGDAPNIERDIRVMSAIDEIPSMDPFLLREHLSRRGISIAPCYFAISEADLARMQDFVAMEINNLIRLTYATAGEGSTYSSKLVQVLLSTEINEHLEPLRIALRLEGEDYREGVFSWKGFLYYKWVLNDLWPKLIDVLREMPQVRVTGHKDADLMAYIERARRRLAETVDTKRREVTEALDVYDRAFADLTKNGKPLAFRSFLLKAPKMFLMLGERIGVISHITSFWRYRFPDPRSLAAPIDEVLDILKDFERNITLVEQ
ncbi:MAG: hypothetical protein ACK5SU_06310 [Phenylobacterium sp.]